jgi:F-type H+-transporting ATPase subunit b
MGAQYQVIIILAVSFVVLVVLLNRFLFKPITKYVDNRRDEIQNVYTKIDTDKKEIVRLSEEYQNKLNQIEKEAYQKIQAAIKEGLAAKTQIISESHLQADNVLRRAKEELEIEKKKAMKEMRQEIISLSIAAAEKVIKQKLDEPANSRIVADFLEEIDKTK